MVEDCSVSVTIQQLRDRILAAALTECCKACRGTGRVLNGGDSVLKTTCMTCLGTGRIDKQQQR